MQQQTKNKDFQFRLMKKSEQWVNKVHEVPETILKQPNKVMAFDNLKIYHPKTVNRQNQQNAKYDNIVKPKTELVKNIVYDSVLFTNEGITKHAKEEIKELRKRGYKIMYVNDYPRNINEENKHLLLNEQIDLNKDAYITILNQPPERWEKSYHLKNLIGFLAFEGTLIKEWVDIINKSPIIELWTPSCYCKDMFIQSGVKKPIYVIPHGIDETVWEPETRQQPNTTDNKFKFLFAGTTHNFRKGYDLVIKAFSEQFKGNDNVELIMKVNKIYDMNQDLDNEINKHIVINGNNNIKIIDSDLTEKEFVELMNMCHCYVSPHYSEGFGINILQAMAVGIPVITTNCTGNMDFCNKDNCLLIETKGLKWADWCYPYWDTIWNKPDLESLKDRMQLAFDNYLKLEETAVKESIEIRNNWTWKKAIDKIEERLKEIQK